jgi:hypothetical protein
LQIGGPEVNMRRREPEMTSTELHSAGATIRHRSPFSELEVPTVDVSDALEWTLPLFRTSVVDCAGVVALVGANFGRVDVELVTQLLTVFNWRPRFIGGYLAAIKMMMPVERWLGHLLLRSDVCYAGEAYCAALARFNTPSAIGYISEYLDYYLGQPDLWFDQATALAALIHLDRRNGTSRATAFEAPWRIFVRNKPRWDLASTVASFEKRMVEIEAAAPAAQV